MNDRDWNDPSGGNAEDRDLDPSRKTRVFVRFSTVVGLRESADTVRDARGSATKFYTEEGNFDTVSRHMAPEHVPA